MTDRVTTADEYAEEIDRWWTIEIEIPTGGYVFEGGTYGNVYFAYGDEAEAKKYVAVVMAGLPAAQRALNGTRVTYRHATVDELVDGHANEASDTVELGLALQVAEEAQELR